MLYSDICLIGLGTLGGFLAKNLSELDTVKNLLSKAGIMKKFHDSKMSKQ